MGTIRVDNYRTAADVRGMTGITDGAAAAAGIIGEELSQTRLLASAISLTTNTTANVTATALTLTAGDWDIAGAVGFEPTGTTSITVLTVAISSVSATLPATSLIAVPASGEIYLQQSSAADINGGNYQTIVIPRYRVNISGSTTLYLVVRATFTVSTLTAWGGYWARRVR